ncbi:uncharacterized protein LOC143022175 [Oratosquilla oratoria]|uniref:uncharacterized protein LOC143022175 n=1 Tax=Oratosquilla oratoria TaxID=337810 RepID=UPI003F774399
MKRKAQDTSGAEGRTRRSTSVGRSCASRAQADKESKGSSHQGASKKEENNEGLRRSSRRAAIQRRIWSNPKRNNSKKSATSMPRFRIVPAPERGQGKSNKKSKEKKESSTLYRPVGRPPKTSVDTKRPLLDTDDSLLSTTKRKVRRKEEICEIKEEKEKVLEKEADCSKNLVKLNSLQNHVVYTNEVKCQIENVKQESESRLEEDELEHGQKSELEEHVLDMDIVRSPKDKRCIEEVVVPEEMSMHKAVVLEIVSDYETSCESGEGSFFQQSTHQSRDSESNSHELDFKVSPVEHYFNIEPQLSPDKCTNDNQTDDDLSLKKKHTTDSKVIKKESGDVGESESETEIETERDKSGIPFPDLKIQSKPVTLVSAQNNLKKGYSEGIEITDENSVELKIRDTDDVTSELPITDDDHVDLSVALAQLVEADGNKESDNGSQDIVTIHSAVPDEQGNLLTHCQVQEAEKIKAWNEEQKACEEEEEDEGELVIREDAEETASLTSEDEHSKALDVYSVGDNENAENEDPRVQDLWLEESKNTELEMRVVKPKTRKQIPPLIKITTRPPVIKTPLKCPECPMQFCTVRSLLWHFGTHGARSTDASLAPILLQDLVVPWDNPTVPVTPAIVQEGDKALSERNSFSPIAFLGELTVPKKDVMQLIEPPKLSEPMTIESVKIPEPTKGATLMNNEEGPSSSSSDVILKVPIPRLKPKVSIQNKFINILPKVKSSIAPQVQAPPTFQSPLTVQSPKMLMPPTSSWESDIKVKPLHIPSSKVNVPQIKITTSKPTNHIQLQSLTSTTAPKVQLQPIAPSSTKCTTSTSNHITLIPMDKLSSLSHVNTSSSKVSPVPVRMVAPTQVPFKVSPSNSSTNDKDGLVMINPNLALRIVSSIPTSTETNMTSTTSTTIQPISSLPGLSQPEGLTILPQVEGGNFMSSYKKDTTPKPDILTIVPQVDVSKQAPPIKEEPTTKTSTSVIGTTTKVPTSAPNSPQVVKFVFLQPKEIRVPTGGGKGTNVVKNNLVEGSQLKKRALNTVSINKVVANGKELSDEDKKSKDTHKMGAGLSSDYDFLGNDVDDDDDDDDEEKEMVIDDGEQKEEEEAMDPLSLCAVTMEDDNHESTSSINRNSDTNRETVAPQGTEILSVTPPRMDPGTGQGDTAVQKHVLPVKSKCRQLDLDPEKYEQRKYVCHYCNRRFGWSTDLKRHVILHTGEKPFQCKVCTYAFTRKFLLQNHMRKMHPDQCKMSYLWP